MAPSAFLQKPNRTLELFTLLLVQNEVFHSFSWKESAGMRFGGYVGHVNKISWLLQIIATEVSMLWLTQRSPSQSEGCLFLEVYILLFQRKVPKVLHLDAPEVPKPYSSFLCLLDSEEILHWNPRCKAFQYLCRRWVYNGMFSAFLALGNGVSEGRHSAVLWHSGGNFPWHKNARKFHLLVVCLH